jgi:hypothetical protein
LAGRQDSRDEKKNFQDIVAEALREYLRKEKKGGRG